VSSTKLDKFSQQEVQYDFPYHFVPSRENGRFSLCRSLWWGFEYLSYIELVRDAVMKRTPAGVLDVGCGDGRLLHEIRLVNESSSLCGIDLSERAISLARHFTPSGVDFKCEDIDSYIEGKPPFDVITLVEVLEHIPPDAIPGFLEAISAALAEEGRLFITVPSTNDKLNRKHFQHFDEASLRRTLEPYFHVYSIDFLNAWSPLVRKIISPLFCNKYFILNHKPLTSRLYDWYCRRYLQANSRNGKRLFATVGLKRK
jgi:2-polyprenyl-3-methyl-5-hydroxy-6-metoxy-1,4-benzoquinol methylase